MINFINKVLCFILGHNTYKKSWSNKIRVSLNRKGGKRTHNIGTRVYKTKHYRIICLRCGKIIKKK